LAEFLQTLCLVFAGTGVIVIEIRFEYGYENSQALELLRSKRQ
jgi:hypothetical protein